MTAQDWSNASPAAREAAEIAAAIAAADAMDETDVDDGGDGGGLSPAEAAAPPWFHGGLSVEAAARTLTAHGLEEGLFIVHQRCAVDDALGSNLCLTLCCNGRVRERVRGKGLPG